MPDLPNDAGCHGTDRCGNCRWWQSDRHPAGDEDYIGLCLHEELAHFQLQVSDESGCNRFAPAEVSAGTGSRAFPPGP
jgi:hypothetical protein